MSELELVLLVILAAFAFIATIVLKSNQAKKPNKKNYLKK